MLRRLMNRFHQRTDDRPIAAPAHRDYVQEREDQRLAQMSEEDQAWGAASLQRDQEAQERNKPPAESDRGDGPTPSTCP
jgi:truncated hemoglobin YjbI